jgi:hypothetical protein
MECEAKLASTLFSLECSLLDPNLRKSAEAAALLADDFVEIGSSGRQYAKSNVLAALAQETPVTITATHFAARQIDRNVVLVTYRACRHTTPPLHSLRSSIWRFDEGRWRLTFHQATPAGDNEGAPAISPP